MFKDTSIEYNQSVQIKNFRYYVASKTAADIELLCFSDDTYAGQGQIIFNDNERFATPTVYETQDEALEKCYQIIEEKISDHEWVQSVKRSLNNQRV